MRNFNNTSGTFQGDPNGVWITANVSINNTNLIANGALSYYGIVSSFNNSLTLPAPNASNPTYVSVQVNNSGTLTLYTSIVSAPTLQAGNIMELYSDIIPANAASDEIITNSNQPILD